MWSFQHIIIKIYIWSQQIKMIWKDSSALVFIIIGINDWGHCNLFHIYIYIYIYKRREDTRFWRENCKWGDEKEGGGEEERKMGKEMKIKLRHGW